MADANGILSSVGDISRIIAEYERQRALGRVQEAGVNQNQGRAEADIFRTRMASAIGGPAAEAKNTALGDTLANVKPFSWTGGTTQVGNIPVPQATGGLTPANFGPATRSAGQALATQSAGRVNDPAFSLPTPPVLPGVPQASGLDKALGTAGGLGSVLGALGNPSSGGGNLLDLAKDIWHGWRGDNTANGLYYDPEFHMPGDPNAQGGVLPGLPGAGNPDQGGGDVSALDDYEEWLRKMYAGETQGGGTGGGSEDSGNDGWGE